MVKSFKKNIFILFILFVYIDFGDSIKLLELKVPKYLPLGARAALSCRWQLGPADVLYSVKWYKDGKEFFRHVPRDVEPRKKFPLPGVDVEESDSSGSRLVLSPATTGTGGIYRCEVSGEKPLFPTVSEHRHTIVVVFPDHGPTISEFHTKYRVGDRVQATCRSGPSQPAAQISWYINGEPLPAGQSILSYRSKVRLIVSAATLDFEVTEKHFQNNFMKVKCLATISPIYWKSHEESAVQDTGNVTDNYLNTSISRNSRINLSNHHLNSTDRILSKYIVYLLIYLQVQVSLV